VAVQELTRIPRLIDLDAHVVELRKPVNAAFFGADAIDLLGLPFAASGG
jgi:hypothetical protein